MSEELNVCMQNVGVIADMLQRCYLPDQLGAIMADAPELPALPDDFLKHAVFYRVNAVRFRERKDIRYAVSSLLAALHQLGKPILFVVRGTARSLDIYMGILSSEGDDESRNNDEVKSALRGFMPGTEPVFCDEDSRQRLAADLCGLSAVAALVGVPSEKVLFSEDKRNGPMEYGLERFIDAMTPNDYALFISALPVSHVGASAYYKQVSSLLDIVHPLTKVSDQHSVGENWTKNFQTGFNKNDTDSLSEGGVQTVGESYQDKNCILVRPLKAAWRWLVGGKTAYPQKQVSTNKSWQKNHSSSFGINISEGFTSGGSTSDAKTVEYINSMATYAEDVLKLLQERLKNGMGEGLWKTTALVLGADRQTAQKSAHMLAGMWSGGKSHQDPLRYILLTDHPKMQAVRKPFLTALPLAAADFLRDHPLGDAYHSVSTWLSSADLAHELNLPHYALPDLAVEKVVEYGRFMPRKPKGTMLKLGEMIDHNVKSDVPVWLDLKKLNRHLFVTGLTGSGKSNTIRAILVELAKQGIPFMVIEPAKKEYRALKKRIRRMHRQGETVFDDMDVYSLSDIGPLSEGVSMNPFAFDVPAVGNPGTALVAHIDRLKSVFNSALGMYSSMPFILEDIIYKAYANMGWNIETGKNKYMQRALELYPEEKREMMEHRLRPLFLPVLSDLKPLVQPALKSFFDGKSDYSISLSGALRSRLDSLTRGNKGTMLDSRISTPLSYNNHGMLERPCVIELESFADNEEKSFIMALLLSRIYEYRIACHDGVISDKLKHVLVIEEAHRLLSQPQKGGEHSADGKSKSVEVFSDMLAEIRAYGQGIIIADQIPAKLIPDVMKNTDVKIVHRLTAKDDREAVGAAMNLTKEQMEDLSKSVPGMATISYGGMDKAARVMMTEICVHEGEEVEVSRTYAMEEYRRDLFTWYDRYETLHERMACRQFDLFSRNLAATLAYFAVSRENRAVSCWQYFADLVNSKAWEGCSSQLLRAFTEDIHRWIKLMQHGVAPAPTVQRRDDDVENAGRTSAWEAELKSNVAVLGCAWAQAADMVTRLVRQSLPELCDLEELETCLATLENRLRDTGKNEESLYQLMICILQEQDGDDTIFETNVLLGLGCVPLQATAFKDCPLSLGMAPLLIHEKLKQIIPMQADKITQLLLKLRLCWKTEVCCAKLRELHELLDGHMHLALTACGGGVKHLQNRLGHYSSREEWKMRLCAYLAAELPYPADTERLFAFASPILANTVGLATSGEEIKVLENIRYCSE